VSSGVFGGYEVGYGFGLGKVEFTVEEGALREFAWACMATASEDEESDYFGLDVGGTVDVEFYGVFACV
jgi:hypothetical protein